MTSRPLFLAAVAVALMASPAFSQPASRPEKFKITHTFPTGVYILTINTQSETATTVGGNDQPKSTSDETQVWELTVGQPNADGQKKCALKLVRIQKSDTSDKTAYDSAKPADAAGQSPGLAFVYQALLAAPATVSLDSDDTVIEVVGLDKLWNGLADKLAADDKAAQTDDDKAQVLARKVALTEVQIELADKAIEAQLRRWESLAPRKAVAVGDKWEAGLRVELPIVGEIKARYACKLADVVARPSGPPMADISCDGVYETTSAQPIKVQGVQMTIQKLTVQETATETVDVNTGLTRSDNGKTTMVAEFTAKDENGKDVLATAKTTSTNKVALDPKKPAEADISAKLVGRWEGKDGGDIVTLDFAAGGKVHFASRDAATNKENDSDDAMYRLQGDDLTITKPDNSASTKMTCKFVDKNTVDMTDEDNKTVRLTRNAGTTRPE